MDPHNILINRLCGLYGWPRSWDHSPFSKLTVRKLSGYVAVKEYLPDETRVVQEAWHIGRVRYFYEELLAGRPIDPISIDNVCHSGRIYAEPVVLDGHHRLAGSVLAKARTIRAWYGGRIDLLNYLTGKRRKCPSD